MQLYTGLGGHIPQDVNRRHNKSSQHQPTRRYHMPKQNNSKENDRQRTVGDNIAVGVGEEDEGEDGEDEAGHAELGGDDKEEQARVVVQALRRHAQQPRAQLYLVAPVVPDAGFYSICGFRLCWHK